jgi:protein-S-isoprenylcysteine O-methyltransferase Ste14
MLTFLWPPQVAWLALLIFTAHAWCQLQRMRNEESVLQAAFPEYEEYKRHTARVVPGLY